LTEPFVTPVATPVTGCYELALRPMADRRGSFLKLFQHEAFRAAGLELDVAELFVSRSVAGVVRGLHFQRPPADVTKLVSCLEGEVLDVVVDLRVDSPSYRRHTLVTLSAKAGNAVFVPKGCAHGFLVAEGEALMAYAQSGPHDPVLEGGILWSSAGVDWPVAPDVLARVVVSGRDAGFPTLEGFASPFTLIR
jgi:dTDP-4-dehydrorhamnose 3,5-epimerase